MSGVNRSLHDECFHVLNVIPRVQFFFKFQIEEIKNNNKNITESSLLLQLKMIVFSFFSHFLFRKNPVSYKVMPLPPLQKKKKNYIFYGLISEPGYLRFERFVFFL